MVDDPVPLTSLRRLLVVKLRHHGDVLLASPLFSVLKNRAPHVEIDALVYADTAPMLQDHPAVSVVHGIDREWKRTSHWTRLRAEWGLLKRLRARRYDLIIHLTDHWRGAWVARLTGARWAVAPAARRQSAFWKTSFTHFVSEPLAGGRHVVERNLDALRRIGIYPDMAERRLLLVPGPASEATVAALMTEEGLHDQRFVQVHPASRWGFKCWPEAKTAALIDRIQDSGWPVALTAAPTASERDMVADILGRIKRPVAADFSGRLGLKELAALTARARLFVGVDSAPMHIAAAVGTPAVALFGPSGEDLWGPWGVPRIGRHIVVASEGYSCRPCGLDGCGGGKVSDCLVTLDERRVWTAVNELLSAAQQQ
ncbi:MAG: putative lipopolysaccharide heptosyltransferase III [Betaproteobacteria bacterium RIFCSPLOWO2_12_FULL_66_14]|nr:MAG: putative lipopolysaccharide heptosyltransferase III [Betaproteobacteria bacterium RIFCSPLOWO2_12_FULL_66_14]